MRIEPFRHLWGVLGDNGSHDDLDQALGAIRQSRVRYVGVEQALFSMGDRSRFAEALQRHELDLIPMAFTAGATVQDHIDSYRMQLEWAKAMPHRFVTAQAGRDSFDESEACRFYDEALKIERDLDVTVGHETHRGRATFTPWSTRRLLDRFPALRLCCDFSHWVVVCERIPDDAEDAIRMAASRAVHVHARVGFEQGPQVSDPAAPEWQRHLEAHERWWTWVWEAQRSRGEPASTFTPEFGPPDYQSTMPRTRAPLSDLWSICDWMAERQIQRFQKNDA